MLVHEKDRHHLVVIVKSGESTYSKNQFTCIQFRVQFIIKCCSCIQLPYAKSFKISRGEKKKKHTQHIYIYINKVRTTSKSNSKCVMVEAY